MKPLLLLLLLATSAFAEDLAYFEKKYNVTLQDIQPMADAKDAERFYTEVAKQLKISDIAIGEASRREQWDPSTIHFRTRFLGRKWLVRLKRVGAGGSIDMRYLEIDENRTILAYSSQPPASTTPGAPAAFVWDQPQKGETRVAELFLKPGEIHKFEVPTKRLTAVGFRTNLNDRQDLSVTDRASYARQQFIRLDNGTEEVTGSAAGSHEFVPVNNVIACTLENRSDLEVQVFIYTKGAKRQPASTPAPPKAPAKPAAP